MDISEKIVFQFMRIKARVVLLPLVFFVIFTHWGLIPGFLIQPTDGARVIYPIYHWIAKELISGNYPSWFPYNYGGIPFPCYAGGVLDFCVIPFFFFSPDTAATVMTLTQQLVLFIVLFFWLRMFGFSKTSSFLTTGLVIWSGPVIFWYGYGFTYSAFIYALLSIIFVEMYYRNNNAWCLFFLSCTVALSALSMSVQHQLNVPIAILITAITRIIMNRQIRPFILILFFLCVGYFMAAINILPLLHSLIGIGRGNYNYGETFHFSPVSLFLAVWSGKEPTIKYPAIYFFICPLLIVGIIMFFIRKCGKKHEQVFVVTGLLMSIIIIVPMYIIPWLVSAYRVADPYRLWFILLLVIAVASTRAFDSLWKDLNDFKSNPKAYWIVSIIMGLFFILFKILESNKRIELLSIGKAVCVFLIPAVVLPFLFLIKKIWIRGFIAVVLFGYNCYIIGNHVRILHIKTLAQNPNGYRDLSKAYTDLLKGASPGTVYSVYKLRYWGNFDKVGPLEPAVSSLWGIRSVAGPAGFLFLPQYIKYHYYSDGMITPNESDFWQTAYPEMSCADAKILARYGIEILLVHRTNIHEFVPEMVNMQFTNFNNTTALPVSWSIFSQPVYGIGRNDSSYILLLNKESVGRAYIQNDDNSLRGLPILVDKSKYVSIDVRGLPKGIRVVLADNYFEGWRVAVDGVFVQPDSFGHFRSVILPNEASVVEWSYSSKYVRTGAAISIFSMLTAITISSLIFTGSRGVKPSYFN